MVQFEIQMSEQLAASTFPKIKKCSSKAVELVQTEVQRTAVVKVYEKM